MGRRMSLVLAALTMAAHTSVGFSQAVSSRASQRDLGGTYNADTLTPLERPKEFASKAFLTEQEAREFVQQSLARQQARNDVWVDRSDALLQIDGRFLTSQIVDPPVAGFRHSARRPRSEWPPRWHG